MKQNEDAMKNLFSLTQLNRICNRKRSNWTEEDIQTGIRYHYSGPHLYRLLVKNGFPFPAPSTLRSWVKNVQLEVGEIDISFKWMKNANLTPMEKVYI